MSWAGFRMRWRGCIKRLNANEGRFCTTIGLPFCPPRGTIIKSNSVSTTNAGNKETWQQKKRKTTTRRAASRKKTRRTAASGGAWHPVCRPFAGGAGLCGGRFGMEGPARCAVRTFWLWQLCAGRGSVLPCCAVYPGRRPSAQDLQAGSWAGVCLRHGDRFFLISSRRACRHFR